MVRRTDRPLGQVRVSFETTRLSPQHLIDAYELLVPEVRHARQRLLPDQARFRIEPVGAAAEHVAGELSVVRRWIVAAKRQLEAVLTARRAVAGARVTAADIECRDHVVSEAKRLGLLKRSG